MRRQAVAESDRAESGRAEPGSSGPPAGIGPHRGGQVAPYHPPRYHDRAEAIVELLHKRIARRFARAEPRERAFAFLRGMVQSAERRNGLRLAKSAGEARPDGMQRLLTTAQWEADALRDDLQEIIAEQLGDPQAVLVLNEAGFAKKGDRSVGVARQFSRSAGVVENCQVGGFLTYVTARAQVIIDRELYLPRQWAEDAVRRRQAGVPADVPFRSKGQLGWLMAGRVLRAGMPAGWVAAEGPFGHYTGLREKLAEHGVRYVLGLDAHRRLSVSLNHRVVELPPEALVSRIPLDGWLRTTDPDDPGRHNGGCHTGRMLLRMSADEEFAQWLLVRRDVRRTRLYICNARPDTSLRELAAVAQQAESAAQCLLSARQEVGLDHYEVRLWRAWYRYITLALFAHASMTLASEGPQGVPLGYAGRLA